MTTPYELRYSLLSMAKDHLERVSDMNRDFAWNAFQASVEAGKATQLEWEQWAPKGFAISDIIQKAEELYTFVNKTAKTK